MPNLSVISAALEVVEQRLCEPMNAADLAKTCYSSYSGLQKLFSYAFDCSVSEYITKRRLSRASNELVTSDKSITEIALQYQYDSPEAFTRAFRRFWGVTPREFRKTRRFTELQPKFKIDENYGGFKMSTRKPVDVTNLYDELKKLEGTYVYGIDIVNFLHINNEYGYAAGDAVIAETFARIERELGGDMLLFRTGGDEFAVVTRYTNIMAAKELARRIMKHNGMTINFGDREIPFSLHVGIGKIPENQLHLSEALEVLDNAIIEAKKTPSKVAVCDG